MRVVTYLSDEWYAAAVAANNRALLSEINKTLIRLIESGEMERLQKQRIVNNE
jgi:ABC-type amino acid transport substrate-binding protein